MKEDSYYVHIKTKSSLSYYLMKSLFLVNKARRRLGGQMAKKRTLMSIMLPCFSWGYIASANMECRKMQDHLCSIVKCRVDTILRWSLKAIEVHYLLSVLGLVVCGNSKHFTSLQKNGHMIKYTRAFPNLHLKILSR